VEFNSKPFVALSDYWHTSSGLDREYLSFLSLRRAWNEPAFQPDKKQPTKRQRNKERQ
jgi:hypothetical protein